MNHSVLRNITDLDEGFNLWDNISYEHKAALWVIDTLGSLFGTGGNLFVLVIFLRTKRLHTKTNTLLMSLIVSGLLMSLTLQPIRADQVNPFFTVGLPYDLANSASIISYFACILSIFCVTLERFIAVWKPLRYVALVTSLRVKVVLAIVWFSSVVFGVTLYEEKYRPIFDRLAIINFTFVIITSVIMYSYIFYVVHKQRKFMQRHFVATNMDGDKRTDNSTIISAIFVSIFILLWLPTLIYLYLKDFVFSKSIFDVHVFIAGQYLISLHLWNGSINWYVYCWKCDKFRKALLQCIGRVPYNEETVTRARGVALETMQEAAPLT